MPVAVHPIDPMPLTAVGKIFKPALRSDAARRVAEQLLEGAFGPDGSGRVTVVSDATHGQVLRVDVQAPEAARVAISEAVGRRLGPLTWRHELHWLP